MVFEIAFCDVKLIEVIYADDKVRVVARVVVDLVLIDIVLNVSDCN